MLSTNFMVALAAMLIFFLSVESRSLEKRAFALRQYADFQVCSSLSVSLPHKRTTHRTIVVYSSTHFVSYRFQTERPERPKKQPARSSWTPSSPSTSPTSAQLISKTLKRWQGPQWMQKQASTRLWRSVLSTSSPLEMRETDLRGGPVLLYMMIGCAWCGD